MQIHIYENFFIIAELFILTTFLYIFCLQLIPRGSLKVRINAYTFTYSLGLLALLTIIIGFLLINTKLNIAWSIFNYCMELTTLTNYFLYLLISSVILCLVFIIKINVTNFQQILKFEIYYLIILCISGGSFIILSNDLLILFLALELYNFGLYSIIGLQQNRVINTEISIKYYLISALSSSFILFGISMIYGFSGLLNFSDLSVFFINSMQFNLPLILGVVLILIGIFVKLGVAPFHFWTPDIYEGTSNIVNLILLTLPKIILICLLLKLIFSTFIFFSYTTIFLAYVIIFSSFYFGTFGAIHQIKIKKFLTYSGISNLAFFL
jgi:NADH-quinone oxidoreductase subunit N